jgi:complex III assembly factor LYRM7
LHHHQQVAKTEQTGDDSTLQNSRKFARDSFDKNRRFKAGSIEAEKAVEHAQGVAQILRENVVQGATDKEASSTYSESRLLPPLTTRGRPTDTTWRTELNIHQFTEKGDNESVKQFKGTTKSFAEVKRCSLIWYVTKYMIPPLLFNSGRRKYTKPQNAMLPVKTLHLSTSLAAKSLSTHQPDLRIEHPQIQVEERPDQSCLYCPMVQLPRMKVRQQSQVV